MILGSFSKQPVEVLDYDIDCSEWIVSDDVLASAVATVDGTGLTIDSVLVSTPRVKVWLSGGTNGSSHKITVTITTDDGRVKQVEFRVRVKDV